MKFTCENVDRKGSEIFHPFDCLYRFPPPDHCGHEWFLGGALRDVRVVCSLAHPTASHPTTLARLATHQVHLLTMSHRMDSDSDDIETYQTPCLCQLKVTHRLTKMLDKTMCGCGSAQIPLAWENHLRERKRPNSPAPVVSKLVDILHNPGAFTFATKCSRAHFFWWVCLFL